MFTLSVRLFSALLLIAALTLSGCQTSPKKGLTPAQVAVLKQQGFELTDDGWEFGLSGKETYNQQLSLRRAKSVANVLGTVGMKHQNIQLQGLGSSEPVASNDTAAGRTENRRVSIVVSAD